MDMPEYVEPELVVCDGCGEEHDDNEGLYCHAEDCGKCLCVGCAVDKGNDSGEEIFCSDTTYCAGCWPEQPT